MSCLSEYVNTVCIEYTSILSNYINIKYTFLYSKNWYENIASYFKQLQFLFSANTYNLKTIFFIWNMGEMLPAVHRIKNMIIL